MRLLPSETEVTNLRIATLKRGCTCVDASCKAQDGVTPRTVRQPARCTARSRVNRSGKGAASTGQTASAGFSTTCTVSKTYMLAWTGNRLGRSEFDMPAHLAEQPRLYTCLVSPASSQQPAHWKYQYPGVLCEDENRQWCAGLAGLL